MKVSAMALQFWLFAILSLTPVLAGTEEEETEVVNDYIDEVLNNLRNNKEIIGKIDPLQVLYIDLPKFKGNDMQIRGLSSLHRSEDCFISHDEDNIYILGHLAVNNIIIELKYKFKVLFWISGKVKTTLNRVGVRIRLSIHKDIRKLNLEEFKVTEFGTFKINKITGLSPLLNWALKRIVQIIVNKARPKIIHLLEIETSKFVRAGLGNISLPKL